MTTFALEWEVKFASINIAGSADLVAAVTAKKLRVLAFAGSLGGTNPTVTLQTGGSTDLSGVMDHPSGEMFVLPYNPAGWCETVAAEKLNAVLAGTTPTLDGVLTYAEVT